MSKRIPKAYAKAWVWSVSKDDPYYVRWLYRLAIFGAPIAFICFATAFALTTHDWAATIFFYIFVLITHPAIIVFLYHDYYYLIAKKEE